MSDDLDRLLDRTTPLDEALRIFARVRATSDEGRAIDLLLARDAQSPLPEPLLTALATALVDRGEAPAAVRAVARATTAPGLMLRAELAARAGGWAEAISLVERVLSRDLDWPGARERRARWMRELGIGETRRIDTTAATIVRSDPGAPFRLLREVGRGGAGAVYEAEDRELGRRVALKVYHRPDRDRAQLLHEARVAVALSGAGVVRVFDVEPEQGWIAMEWVTAGALRGLLRSAAASLLTPIERWAVPLARSLARVHAAGWVHLDVKPANVLLSSPTEPLLTDFGTARRSGEPSPPGSLGYVSPERLAGRASHPRDDVYGFGRVLDDALHALGEADPRAAHWASVAAMCAGPDEARPADGSSILRALG